MKSPSELMCLEASISIHQETKLDVIFEVAREVQDHVFILIRQHLQSVSLEGTSEEWEDS